MILHGMSLHERLQKFTYFSCLFAAALLVKCIIHTEATPEAPPLVIARGQVLLVSKSNAIGKGQKS